MQDLKNQFRLAVDTIPELFWICLSDGHVDFLNQRWREYTGLTLEEASGWGWQAAVHPDDLPGLVDYWRSVLASGKMGETEARLRRYDGEYHWFLFRAVPLYDESGSIVKWYGTNTDIEERKRAEEALKRSEDYLRLVIDTIPGLVWSAMPDGHIEYLNKRWIDYTGLTLEEASGWGWQTAIHPEDLPGLLDYWKSILAAGKAGETEARLRRFFAECLSMTRWGTW